MLIEEKGHPYDGSGFSYPDLLFFPSLSSPSAYVLTCCILEKKHVSIVHTLDSPPLGRRISTNHNKAENEQKQSTIKYYNDTPEEERTQNIQNPQKNSRESGQNLGKEQNEHKSQHQQQQNHLSGPYSNPSDTSSFNFPPNIYMSGSNVIQQPSSYNFGSITNNNLSSYNRGTSTNHNNDMYSRNSDYNKHELHPGDNTTPMDTSPSTTYTRFERKTGKKKEEKRDEQCWDKN